MGIPTNVHEPRPSNLFHPRNMHYVPESAREFLQEDPVEGTDRFADRSFHYRSAPIYLLTALVGLLLLADFACGLLSAADPAWAERQSLFGFRLALLAAVLGGARILYQTLETLLDGRVGADLALTIACLAAIMLGEHTTAALVVFIALVGESIEGFTVDRAQQAIRKVFNLCPRTAHVLRDGQEVTLAVHELAVGDMLVVRPGERVPVDGSVTAGTSTIDESPLTGESLPVDKSPGDPVFAGTLNHFGALTLRADKVGGETTLAQVIRLVAEATERKAPIERTADRLARLFLPVVLLVAMATLIGWRLNTGSWRDGFLPALSVLVVACPCPLVLATPSAVMAAMAWLARTGVVVKGSLSLEQLAQVDTFIFDKTGTLTRGELVLADIRPVAPLDETELLRVAAIAERRSEHLLGRLIVNEAESRNLVVPAVEHFTAHPGAGVVAMVRETMLGDWANGLLRGTVGIAGSDAPPGHLRVIVGNRRLMQQHDVELPEDLNERIDALDAAGQTVLIVAVSGHVLGLLGVRDAVRAESRAVINELRQAGITRLAMLTGDRANPANNTAAALGLSEEVHAELMPADKARWVEEQIRSGRRVAMVGDGVNDAPALAAATVGIALGGVGSDIAAEAGDLVLMGDPLRPLPGLLRLSRQMVKIIRQSIVVYAFGMNALGIALSAVGLLEPAAAALFHEFASLAVMFNALRLLWFERWHETRLGGLSNSVSRLAEWLTAALSPSRWVFRVVDRWNVWLRLAAMFGVVAWLLSGVVVLRENEQALVTRFGGHYTTLAAGLHWRWPAPFEEIIREDVGRVRTVQIGFRSAGVLDTSETGAVPPIEWTSDHAEDDFDALPLESLTLSGDEVLVELTAEAHWRIADLKQYAYAVAAPDAMLRAAAENAMREVAVEYALPGLLTDRRLEVERRCLALLKSTIALYGMGVEVLDLHLLDVHPPRQVVPDYRQVADALEQHEQLINEAEAYYARKVLSAAGEGAIRNLSAGAEQVRVADALAAHVSATTGDVASWSVDDATWDRLTAERADGSMQLSGEAAARLLRARQEAVRRVESARGGVARFKSLYGAYQAHESLTALQLYWTTIEQTLSSRPLTILDPEVAGRKHLLLSDPAQFPAAPALSLPREEDEVLDEFPELLPELLPGEVPGEIPAEASESRSAPTASQTPNRTVSP